MRPPVNTRDVLLAQYRLDRDHGNPYAVWHGKTLGHGHMVYSPTTKGKPRRVNAPDLVCGAFLQVAADGIGFAGAQR